jgi:hypothetical protein
MVATVCRPPADCEGWQNDKESAYAEMHTWGRLDRTWTLLCTSGIPKQYVGHVAAIAVGIIKGIYGDFIKFLAYCPCFVDYAGTFKSRTEKIGIAVLVSGLQVQ